MFDGVPEEDGPIVPEGWTPTTLGEVVPPPRPKIDSTPDSDLAFIGMEHIDAHSFTLNGQDQLRNFKSQASHFLPGEVLYGRLRPYLNKVHKARFEGAASAEFLVLTASERIDADFLRFLLHQMRFVQFANERSSGDRPRVKFDDIAEFEFALPPLADQRRIVSRIEELFSQVEAGERAIGAARRDLARYRRSVLHAAVTGALTEDWRAANPDPEEDGEALLARLAGERRAAWERAELDKLTAKGKPAPETEKQWATFRARYEEAPSVLVEDLPDLPSSWAWATLPQLGEFGRGKSNHRPRGDASLYGGDYPFFQTGQVRQSLGKITTWDKTYNEKGLAQSRLWPEGTVCITIAANIAATGIMQFDGCFPDSVVGLIPHPDIGPEYPEFFLRTERDNLDEYAPATAQKNINLDILEQVAVPLPPIREQGELVSTVQVELSRADAVEKNLDAQTRAARALKQSVLKAAFAGQLA